MITTRSDNNELETLRADLAEKDAKLARAFSIMQKMPALVKALATATVWIEAELDDAPLRRGMAEDRVMVAEFRKLLGAK